MSLLLIKDGVQPQLIRLIAAAINAATKQGIPAITVTAGIDGVHGADSLHYALRAIDIRTHDLTNPTDYLAALKVEAGAHTDVFIEAAGTPNEHIHLEHDACHS